MRQSTTGKNIIVFVTAALTFTTAACTTPAAAPTPPEPEQVSFAALDADAQLLSHRWNAPAGVSLDLRILQAVRSYVESTSTYSHTADPASVHPGFWDIRKQWESTPTPEYGTVYHHILLIEPSVHIGEPVTEVLVCSDYMHTAISTRHAWIRIHTMRYTPLRIRLTTARPATTPALDYEHRLPYPTWNVFEGLEIERADGSRGSERPMWTICDEDMPGYNPEVPEEEELPAAPVVEPFYPGWPTVVEDDE
ncbi:hypothetical protein HCA61_18835 [Rhodococcus sp. HNM0563]|nr:hypothetical protein [Rhodococcus sp. HNM0563]